MDQNSLMLQTNGSPDGSDIIRSSDHTTQPSQGHEQASDSLKYVVGYLGEHDNGEFSEVRVLGYKRAHDRIGISPLIMHTAPGQKCYQIKWVNWPKQGACTLDLLPAVRIFTARSTQIDAIIPPGLTLKPLEVDYRLVKAWVLLLPPAAQDTEDNWAIAISSIDERDWTMWEIAKNGYGDFEIKATTPATPPTTNDRNSACLGEIPINTMQMGNAIPYDISEKPESRTRGDIIMETWSALHERNALNSEQYEFGKRELTNALFA